MVPKGWCYPSAHPERAPLLLLHLSTGPRQALSEFSQHNDRTCLTVPMSSLSQGHEPRNSYELRGKLFCLLHSTFLRPHLHCCIQLWGSQHRKDIDLLKQVQRRPQTWLEGWNTSSVRKSRFGFLTQKKRGPQGELLEAYRNMNTNFSAGPVTLGQEAIILN